MSGLPLTTDAAATGIDHSEHVERARGDAGRRRRDAPQRVAENRLARQRRRAGRRAAGHQDGGGVAAPEQRGDVEGRDSRRVGRARIAPVLGQNAEHDRGAFPRGSVHGRRPVGRGGRGRRAALAQKPHHALRPRRRREVQRALAAGVRRVGRRAGGEGGRHVVDVPALRAAQKHRARHSQRLLRAGIERSRNARVAAVERRFAGCGEDDGRRRGVTHERGRQLGVAARGKHAEQVGGNARRVSEQQLGSLLAVRQAAEALPHGGRHRRSVLKQRASHAHEVVRQRDIQTQQVLRVVEVRARFVLKQDTHDSFVARGAGGVNRSAKKILPCVAAVDKRSCENRSFNGSL